MVGTEVANKLREKFYLEYYNSDELPVAYEVLDALEEGIGLALYDWGEGEDIADTISMTVSRAVLEHIRGQIVEENQ